MRNIKHSIQDPITFIDSIGENLQEEHLIQYRSVELDVKQRYSTFADKHKQLETINPLWNTSNSADVPKMECTRKMYSRERKSIKNLWDELHTLNGEGKVLRCPLCGLNYVYDLDHYMPKSIYPQYAVHPQNLIPICHRCNNKKLEKWVDHQNKRVIFNAYFDIITFECPLICNIIIQDNLPLAIVSISTIHNSPIIDIMINTINILDLKVIYDQVVNERLRLEIQRTKEYIKEGINYGLTDINKLWNMRKNEYSSSLKQDIPEFDYLLFTGLTSSTALDEWIVENIMKI